MGAGDAAFMRTATVVSALAGFLPLVWLSLVFGWGLAGICRRAERLHRAVPVFGLWRAVSGRWAVTGTG